MTLNTIYGVLNFSTHEKFIYFCYNFTLNLALKFKFVNVGYEL